MNLTGKRAVLSYSGGKDSTAVLHWLCENGFHGQFEVMTCDTGEILQEIREFIAGQCERLDVPLTVIQPQIPLREWHQFQGLPTDILPIEHTWDFETVIHGDTKGIRLQSYMKCCETMIWMPTWQYFLSTGTDVVIRGSRKEDARVGVEDGYQDHGIHFWSPLWHWTTDDVLDYLKYRGVALPRHYQFFQDSLDCWLCTGHLKHAGKERLEFIQQFYPELWPELQLRLRLVNRAITEEYSAIHSALEMGNKDG